MIAGMLCSTAAFAADPIEAKKEGSVVTVTVSELGSKEETTLLVVAKDVTIEDAFDDTTKVYHIDQTAANDSGVATFTFTYTGSESLDVYSGYSSMSATDVPYETVLDLSGSTGGEGGDDDDPVTPELPADFMYGDVNHDIAINASDASAVISYILKAVPFTDASTGAEYAYGIKAANVDGTTDDTTGDATINASDASLIISRILKGTSIEFPAEDN